MNAADVAIWMAIAIQLMTVIGSAVGIVRVLRKQDETHILINSRLSQLLDVTAAKNLAEGRALGPIVPTVIS